MKLHQHRSECSSGNSWVEVLLLVLTSLLQILQTTAVQLTYVKRNANARKGNNHKTHKEQHEVLWADVEHTSLTLYGRPYPCWRGAGLSEISCFRSLTSSGVAGGTNSSRGPRLPGCWDISLASLSISPLFQRKRGPPSVARNQDWQHTPLFRTQAMRARPSPQATPCEGAGLRQHYRTITA